MTEKRFFPFEKLDVWHRSRLLISEVYALTRKFPNEEKFSLVMQVQRAAISVASNIAEGSTRSSLKEQCRFTEIAYGSLMELYCQLILSKDLNYITEENFERLQVLIEEVFNKLNALKNSQLKRMRTTTQ